LTWNYDSAFSRNLGLIQPDEQQCLRHACVAIAGLALWGEVCPEACLTNDREMPTRVRYRIQDIAPGAVFMVFRVGYASPPSARSCRAFPGGAVPA